MEIFIQSTLGTGILRGGEEFKLVGGSGVEGFTEFDYWG